MQASAAKIRRFCRFLKCHAFRNTEYAEIIRKIVGFLYLR